MARSADERGYNGWTNYATWNVHLWLTNDPQTEATVRSLALRAPSLYEAAQAIRTFVEDRNPLAEQASLYTDLLGNALGHVDWDAVAHAFRAA